MKKDETMHVSDVIKLELSRTTLSVSRLLVLTFSIMLIPSLSGFAQVRIGLFENKSVEKILVSPVEGRYFLLNADLDTVYRFRSDDAVLLISHDSLVIAKSAYGLKDTLAVTFMVSSDNNSVVRARVNDEKGDGYFYGSLQFSTHQNQIKLVNAVSIERYVSRVVQAEVGFGAEPEYYKIQSIICRTYAVRNLERHSQEGFDLCDNMHCQVYSGRKDPTDEVVKATAATAGLVMISKENDLVLSAFHANCGGQTANSEDVWKESRSYLKTVIDTFCLNARSATWEKSISSSKFFNQLEWKNTASVKSWKWGNKNRKRYFTLGKDSIRTSKMRRIFALRSAFFDLELANDTVTFKGNGYGHGVGLCQQGAMKMAESGYTYSQILGYYYKGVSLAPISKLQPTE